MAPTTIYLLFSLEKRLNVMKWAVRTRCDFIRRNSKSYSLPNIFISQFWLIHSNIPIGDICFKVPFIIYVKKYITLAISSQIQWTNNKLDTIICGAITNYWFIHNRAQDPVWLTNIGWQCSGARCGVTCNSFVWIVTYCKPSCDARRCNSPLANFNCAKWLMLALILQTLTM